MLKKYQKQIKQFKEKINNHEERKQRKNEECNRKKMMSKQVKQELIEIFGKGILLRRDFAKILPDKDLYLDLTNDKIVYDSTELPYCKITHYSHLDETNNDSTNGWMAIEPTRNKSQAWNSGYKYMIYCMWHKTQPFIWFIKEPELTSKLKIFNFVKFEVKFD